MPPPTQTSIPRAWWLRRILAATLIALALLLAMRLIAGLIVDRQWARQVAQLEREGISLRAESFQPEPVPDALNAAPIWRNAFAAMNTAVDSPRSSNFDSDQLGWYPPYLPQWHTLASASATANAATFALAEQAAQLPACDWGTVYRSPLNAVRLTSLNLMRELANKLADSAELLSLQGEHDQALRRISAGLTLADHVRVEPILIAQLVAAGIDSLSCNALRPHISAIRIGSESGHAPPTQVRSLIASLIDPARGNRIVDTLSAEAAFTADSLDAMIQRGWLLEPVLMRDKARILDVSRRVRVAARTPRGPGRDRVLAEVDASRALAPAGRALPRFSRPLHTFFYGFTSNQRAVDVQEQVLAGRRVLAIAIAVRWYQLDHGRSPATLADLIPTYLPRLPDNPLSAGGTPFEYVLFRTALPDGGDRPMLFIDRGLPRVDPPVLPQYETHLPPRNTAAYQWSDLSSWTPTDEQFKLHRPY